jgi:transposase
MNRHELTSTQWERLQPLLPPQKPTTGRPNRDHRTIINGILWILRTGAPWRDLPERYGPWRTVASRFYRWRQAGIWDQILATLQTAADAAGDLDWSVHMLDGSIVRAHQHAAGAKKGTHRPKRSAIPKADSAPNSISAPTAPAASSRSS